MRIPKSFSRKNPKNLNRLSVSSKFIRLSRPQTSIPFDRLVSPSGRARRSLSVFSLVRLVAVVSVSPSGRATWSLSSLGLAVSLVSPSRRAVSVIADISRFSLVKLELDKGQKVLERLKNLGVEQIEEIYLPEIMVPLDHFKESWYINRLEQLATKASDLLVLSLSEELSTVHEPKPSYMFVPHSQSSSDMRCILTGCCPQMEIQKCFKAAF
ncbi:hypothetical protein Syun_022647 [Stephania yunnanensis]|uniref:Uncharacterized protein n=1 Tax=Stephania yunnanensis TaxID=152371 RepID=A0AAP0I2X1_9MAGN